MRFLSRQIFHSRPFNLHLDFWKSRSWEIKFYVFQNLEKFQTLKFFQVYSINWPSFFHGGDLEKKSMFAELKVWNRTWFSEIRVQIKRLTGGSFCPLFQTKFPDFTCQRCSTCLLVFGCWDLSHVIFLKLRKKKNCLQTWGNSQKDNYYF